MTCDTTVNTSGRELIELCKTYGFYILNGRYEPDRNIGNYTYICTNGCSVIDYGLCSGNVLRYMSSFSVEQRTESKHFPILMKFEYQSDLKPANADSKLENKTIFGYKMLDEERELFFDNLSDVLTNSVYRKICSSIDDPSISVNDIVEQFHTVLKQAGEDFRKKPKRNTHRTNHRGLTES